MKLFKLSAISFALAILCSILSTTTLNAQEKKLPKKIYGHYMGCFCAGTGAIYYHMTTGLAALNAPKNCREKVPPLERQIGKWAPKSHAGSYRNFALSPYGKRIPDKEAADLEIRRAMRIGLDGFTFDAWAGGDKAMKLLDLMFEVCEENEYPFELTISLDSSCIKDNMEELKPYEGNKWVKSVKWLLDKHGDSPNLARRDGKVLIMGYQSIWPGYSKLWDKAVENVGKEDKEKIKAEVNRLRFTPEGWNLIADSYDEMEKQIGQPIYWEFCLSAFFHNARGDKKKIVEAAGVLAKRFPALGMFMWEESVPEIAKVVRAAGAEWSHPMKLQYENFGWWQGASPGTDWMRGDWGFARENSDLIQFITWNDYHENTNLSPGINTRYTHYDLTGYFIKWWKEGKEPAVDRDKIYIYSHKYSHNTPMYPFKAKSRNDNVIEVVTLLKKPAVLRAPGRELAEGGSAEWEAPKGYSFKKLKLTPGPVVVELLRGGKTEIKLDHPEPVSDKPFRQCTGKNCWSTEFERLWKEDFGDAKPYIYSEYGDLDGDGLPNWFEMLWFGKFGDLSTATDTKPDGDPDGDGRVNLEEWKQQKDPTKKD
jgi:hypothetical protein